SSFRARFGYSYIPVFGRAGTQKNSGVGRRSSNRAGILRDRSDRFPRLARRVRSDHTHVPIFVSEAALGTKSPYAGFHSAGRNRILAVHARKLLVAAVHDRNRNKLRDAERADNDLANRLAGVRPSSFSG